MRGGGESCGVPANEYSGAQINFGYLTPYLTYGARNLSNMPRNALAGNFLEAYSFSIVFSIGFSFEERQRRKRKAVNSDRYVFSSHN